MRRTVVSHRAGKRRARADSGRALRCCPDRLMVLIGGRPGARRSRILLARVRYLPKLSNSPFRTPPRNACHSSGVNWRTAPSASLLFRTPTPPSARPATSTQLPFEKLSELLIQVRPEFGLSDGFPRIGIPMSFTLLICCEKPRRAITTCSSSITNRNRQL